MLNSVIEQFRFLAADLKRWKCSSLRDYFYTFFEQGVWATVFYRVGRALFLIDVPIVKIVLRFAAFLLMKFAEIFLGAAIKPAADIGPGLYVGHVGMIRIHPQCIIGKNFSLGPGVILGQKGLGTKGAPKIGDDVYIGTGAKILGPVKIGSKAVVGANAVVTKDVPAGAVAVGVPMKILEKKK